MRASYGYYFLLTEVKTSEMRASYWYYCVLCVWMCATYIYHELFYFIVNELKTNETWAY